MKLNEVCFQKIKIYPELLSVDANEYETTASSHFKSHEWQARTTYV